VSVIHHICIYFVKEDILETFEDGSSFKMYIKMQFLPHRKQKAPLYKYQSVKAVQGNNRHVLNEMQQNTGNMKISLTLQQVVHIFTTPLYRLSIFRKDVLAK
jgi:hypothetical protein